MGSSFTKHKHKTMSNDDHAVEPTEFVRASTMVDIDDAGKPAPKKSLPVKRAKTHSTNADPAMDIYFKDPDQCEDILAPILEELAEYPGEIIHYITHQCLGFGESGYRLRLTGLKYVVERRSRVGTGRTAHTKWQAVIYAAADINQPVSEEPVYRPRVKSVYDPNAKKAGQDMTRA